MKDETNNGEVYEPINIQALAKKAKPCLASVVPSFVYRKIERLLRLPELNPFFARTHNFTPDAFLHAVVQELNISLVIDGCGVQTLKQYAGTHCMFASNHPYGGPESMVAMDYLRPLYPDLKILAQSYLKYIKPLRGCSVFNKGDIKTLQQAIRDKVSLMFFPAGYCSRVLSNGEIFDYAWKKSFVHIAKKNNFPIFVFHIHGKLSDRTLRWTKFRKLFHIKTSFESIFLPDEMYRLQNTQMHITVGEVIMPEVITSDVSEEEWAARLRQYCYKLRSDPNAVFDPHEKSVLTDV